MTDSSEAMLMIFLTIDRIVIELLGMLCMRLEIINWNVPSEFK